MSFRFLARGLLLLTGLVAFAGCFSSLNPLANQNSTRTFTLLANSNWTLAKWISPEGKSVSLRESTPTLYVGDLGGVSGNAGVNRYFGTARLADEDKIDWSKGLGTTRMAGKPELMERETRYLSDLQNTHRATVSGNRLVLTGDAKLRLEFTRTPAAPAP